MVRLYFVRATRLALPLVLGVASLHVPLSLIRAQQASADRRASVVLLDFTVTALKDAADWAPLGKGIPQILNTEMSTNPDIRIVDRERLQTVLDELKLTQASLVEPATAARVRRFQSWVFPSTYLASSKCNRWLTGSYRATVLRLEKGRFEEKDHRDREQRTNHHRIPTFLSTNEPTLRQR